jgi:hypothetical protein
MSQNKFASLSKSASQQVNTPAIQQLSESQPKDKPIFVGARFSRLCSDTLNHLAIDEGKTLKAWLGEAIDDAMRKRGKHPFGER